MPIPFAADEDWKTKHIDSVMDEAHARKLEIQNRLNQIKSAHGKGGDIHPSIISEYHDLDNESKQLDSAINHILNASEENVPYSYKEHYRVKYLKEPEFQGPEQQALPEEPSSLGKMLSGAWEGTKDTAKLAFQHPQRFGAHVSKGVEDFASLPFRAVEGAVMGEKGEFPILSAKRWAAGRKADVAKGDVEAGVAPDSTGGNVAEAVGSMVIPVGPSLKAGHHLGNILKGAGFAGGINAAEQLATKGDIEAREVVPSALAGGVITGGLSALLGRGRAPIPGAKSPIDVTPKQLEAPIRPGEMRGGTVYGDMPPGSVAGEGKPIGPKPKPGPGPGAEAATPTRPPITERAPEAEAAKPSIRTILGLKPNEPLPPVPGAEHVGDVREFNVPGIEPSSEVRAGMLAAQAKGPEVEARIAAARDKLASQKGLKDVLKLKPLPSKAQPSAVAEVSPNVLPVAKEPGGIAKAMAKPKIKVTEGEVLTPSKALDVAKQMDEEAALMAKEATLKDVISGKTDVSKLPVKRGAKSKGPKSEALAPAVKGEVGAPTDWQAREDAWAAKAMGDPNLSAKGKERLAAYVKKVGPSYAEGIAKGEGDVIDVKAKPSEEIDFFGERPLSKVGLRGDGTDTLWPARPAASGQMSKSKAELPAKEIPREKPIQSGKTPKVELQPKRTEDFIKEQGYQVREREPFPGQKEYDLVHPKTGSVVARGDRAQLTAALGLRPEAKGLKLYSFPGDLNEFATTFKDKLRTAGARIPEGVTVENTPHKAGTINTLLRPLETPEFNLRKQAAGNVITDAGRDADRGVVSRVHDLIHTPSKTPSGVEVYTPTKLKTYFELADDVRKPVDSVLVLGDKEGTTYTPEQLIKHGLNHEQVSAYQGVREALDIVKGWVKEMSTDLGEFAPKIEGYIPRVWKGDWEIFVNGNKYLKPSTQTSSFMTLSDAAAEAHIIKSGAKDAKVSIKFFPDPEYLTSHGLTDARAVAKVKANLEKMGYMASDAVDEAFKMGKSVKGFAKHLLERKDAVGYETQDLHKILNSYFYQAARRVEMQKLKNVAENVLKDSKVDLSPGQVRYIQEYVERVAGKPAWDEIAIHNFVRETPIGKWIDPVRGGKLIASSKDLVTHLTLGFGNVGWAMINLDGLTRHVWPLLASEAKMVGAKSALASEKYMIKGIQGFFKDKALRQMLAHHGIIDIQMMSEQIPKIGHAFGEGKWTRQKISMLLGTATEEFSRGVAAIARYHMAIDHGATPTQAMQSAARFVEQTLGRYSRGGRPPAFTGAIGSTVGLFKTYMAVMLQNGWRAFESKDIGTITRYIAGAVGVSGVLGLVPGIEDLDSAITKHTGWSPIETIEKNLPPAVTTGLLTLTGVDISRRAGVPEIFPNDARGWAGPVIGRFATTISDLVNGEPTEAMLDMLPNSIRNVIAVARGYNEGKVIGRLDKPSYNVTPKEAVLHAVGLTPTSEASDSRLYQRNVNKEAYRENTLSHLTRKIAKGKASDEDYAKFQELGGKRRRVRNEQRREDETLVERQYRHLPKILRRQQPAS